MSAFWPQYETKWYVKSKPLFKSLCSVYVQLYCAYCTGVLELKFASF